ncbi:MAG TPA: HNH endonuclease, partial [Acidimicrobiales bacterium]|nr:HNH endonuclease [Acidimicrobiales bacterium]
LVERAAGASLSELRDHCRRRRLQADDVDQAHRRQHAERAARHRQDDHGMTQLTALFPPELGVAVANRIDAEVDARLRQRKQHHQPPEPIDALRADAVADLILGRAITSGRRLGRPELILVCDISAYQRGHTQPGETCHIIGAGPVPVTVARQLATDAFIKAVLHDGTKIDTVAHHRSRYQPAWLKTALQLGDHPDFTGVACTNCANRYGIDWDHQHPYANGGPTSLDNLHPLCWACHQQKTRQDRAAGLLKPAPPTPAPGPAPLDTATTPAPVAYPDTDGQPAAGIDTAAPMTPGTTPAPDPHPDPNPDPDPPRPPANTPTPPSTRNKHRPAA